VFVNGVDAEPRAQELIRQGLMTLSNFTDFWQSGVEAASAAVKLAKGEKIDTGWRRGMRTELEWPTAPRS
jgi:D-xylose transport system substrate-binding protein